MCQRVLAFAVMLAACAPAPRVTSHPAPQPRAFTVRYREAANAFAIVDQISGWFPEKLDPEYAEGWKQRFGVDPTTDPQLVAWGEVRKRHWQSPPAEDAPILIGYAKPLDTLALAFYGEDDLGAAFARVAPIVGPDDANVLRATFAHVKPQLDELLAESRAFTKAVSTLQEKLDDGAVSSFVAELTRFYRSGAVPPFTVEFVWWPPVGSSAASVVSDTLLLRYSPTKQLDEASKSTDIALHEVAHYVSLHQPEDQKRALTKAFLAKCPEPPKLNPARLLEEPLAVAHQKMFLQANDPAHFDRERPWYGDPWSSVAAKMIFEPIVSAHAEHRVLDERIAFAAGRSCRELSALSAPNR